MCIYNKDIKERYIKEKNEITILPDSYLERLFKKTEIFETKLNKDVSNFTFYEIEEMYKTWSMNSLASLQVINSHLSMYTQWCLQQSLVLDSQNHYLEFTKDKMVEYINLIVAKKKFITRLQLIEMISQLPNASDEFLLLALFEGISGKEYCELTNLKKTDFNGNEVTLCTGRKIKISNVLLNLAEEAGNTYEYYPVNSDKREKFPFDLSDEKIIKDYYNAEESTSDFQMGRRIYRKLRRIFAFLGIEYMSANALVESGKVHFINERCKALRTSSAEYIFSKEGEGEIKEQFGSNFSKSSRIAFVDKFKEYLI